MNVASKDLCQELYELSGWSDPDVELRSDIQYGYTLGYLLRKLPMYVKGGRLEMIYELDEDGQPWCFGYHYGSQRVIKRRSSIFCPGMGRGTRERRL